MSRNPVGLNTSVCHTCPLVGKTTRGGHQRVRAAQTVSLQEAEPAADLGPWTGASLYSGCYLVSRLVPAIFYLQSVVIWISFHEY